MRFVVQAMQRLVAIMALAAVAIGFTLMAAPRAALAEPPDAKPSASSDSVGRAHFQRGQKLSASGQYAAAYREFAAGYAATKRPLFLFNMAEAARADGDTAKARDAYQEFLRADPKSALAATARTRLAEIDPSATRPDEPRVPQSSPESAPSISTAPPPGPPTEPVPFMPPSVTRPQPAPDGLPPERFSTERAGAEDRPLWKKWPFWAVVGGVVAGGVVVFAVTRDHGTACGPGCSEIDFRPPR